MWPWMRKQSPRVVFIFLLLIVYVALYFVLTNVYLKIDFFIYTSLYFCIPLNGIFIYLSYRLMKILKSVYQKAFLFFFLGALFHVLLEASVIILNLKIVSAEFQTLLYLFGRCFFYGARISQIIAWGLLIRTFVRNKHHLKMMLVSLPILVTGLLALSFLVYSMHWYERVDNVTADIMFSTYFQILLFLILILTMSAARRNSLVTMAVGFLFIVMADISAKSYTWEMLHDSSVFWSVAWLTGKICLIVGAMKLLDSQSSKNRGVWFFDADSLRTQVVLWSNSLVSLLFFSILIYYFIAIKSPVFLHQIFRKSMSVYVPFLGGGSLLSVLFSRFLERPFHIIEQVIYSASKNKTMRKKVDLSIKEFRTLENYLQRGIQKISQKTKLEQTLFDTASKAVHDVRSPLSVLSIVAHEVRDKIGGEREAMLNDSIGLITRICNELLDQYKLAINESNVLGGKPVFPDFVAIALLRFSKQKKLMFVGTDVHFHFEFSPDCWFKFAKVDSVVLRRVVNNLVSNSVEASSKGEESRVNCSLELLKNGQLQIVVNDSGCGITKTKIEEILQQKARTTKLTGSGIGMRYVVSQVKKWGGEISIHSVPNQGTQITVTLPTVPAPDWSAVEMRLTPNQPIVVFDDEREIFSAWQRRLMHFPVELHTCSTASAFKKLVGKFPEAFFLVDQNIKGCSTLGLDNIVQHHLTRQSLLVTSEFENPSLQARCLKAGVKIVPKLLIEFLPVQLAKRH